MKPFFVLLFLATALPTLLNAACPELEQRWFIKKVSYVYSDHTGDYTLTAQIPDLKNLKCEIDPTYQGLVFDLSASPIVVTVKNNSTNKITQTTKYSGVKTRWQFMDFINASKKLEWITSFSGLMEDGGSYLSNYRDAKVLSRW